MSMKEQFREIVQDITDGYCGGWTCLSDGEIRYCEADVEVTDRIYKLKEEQKMAEKWYLYYAKNSKDRDVILIAQTLDDAIEYWGTDFGKPVYFAEADSRDTYARAVGDCSVLTLTEYLDGTPCFATQKYADKINYLKFEYNKETHIPTGGIKVTYEDGHTREFDDVTEYKEVVSMLEEKQLYIKNAVGRRYYIPLAKVKEYVVDMPNDKRIVIEPQDDVIDKEKFLSMFNVGSYYKISYTDDIIEGDKNTFCIIRFKEYLFDKEAIFENIYDHRMGLVPLIRVDILNIRNDDYTIVKIPYGGDIRE